ncbi:MAG: carbohydrate deacetylase [Clostridia bacterium]|nr:carbohydrate deacetylase [Clostridia bacterium]
MKLIINADDFGLSESVNKGIVECYKKGLISSTTMMMNTPYTEQAVALAKKNKISNIGIHLNLTYGHSILPKEEVQSLVDENGIFHYVCMLGYHTQYVDAKKELKAQIEKFLATGLKPTHLDHHHYFNEIPNILKAYLELAKEYNLPVRCMDENARNEAKKMGLKTTDEFSFAFHGQGVTPATFDVLRSLFWKSDITLEILSHVGYIDEYTKAQTRYLLREDEIKVLAEVKKKGILDEVQMIGFGDL